jgi:hypothetical protein
MAGLTVPFLMPKVEEVVPDYVLLKDRLSSASVIEERYTATQVPSSGDSYAVGGSGSKLMTIRISNQNDYIDTSTLVLTFRAQASAASDLAVDDHIFSLVDTINVKVGGQTVEVLNNVGHLVNTLVQGSMPVEYYNNCGGFEGLYCYAKNNNTLGANLDNRATVTNSSQLQARWTVGNGWLNNGRYYSVPLTMLGISRLDTLFAARNFQDLTLEFLFKSSVNSACWTISADSIPTFAGQINITDVSLTYDCCRMSADYYALMDNELRMPNGSGVSYAIDTYQIQPATLAAGSLGGATTGGSFPGALNRVIVAKGTRFLKSVYGVTKVTEGESNTTWRNNSSSQNASFSSYQVVINSKRYPQLQIQSCALAFQELQKAYNNLGSISAGTVMNWFNYVGQPNARVLTAGIGIANGAANTSGATAVALTVPQDSSTARSTSVKDGSTLGAYGGDEAMFQVGVNLEQFLTNQPDAGGINTSTSGYQIAIEIQQNPVYVPGENSVPGYTATSALAVGTAATHYVILHFTRVLTLKAGAVEILD